MMKNCLKEKNIDRQKEAICKIASFCCKMGSGPDQASNCPGKRQVTY